jgi:hypothetical protein
MKSKPLQISQRRAGNDKILIFSKVNRLLRIDAMGRCIKEAALLYQTGG